MFGLGSIQGQEQPVALLRRALRSGKLPHAYLFSGPPGVGKATTGLALAMAMNCESTGNVAESQGDGCGECTPCQKILGGRHPDVLVVRPQGAGNFIVVDDIRDLVGKLGYPPHEGRARVVIVEDADRLRVEAANAFLKTLEEPPPRTHFILVTPAADQLLVTIRSRCQRVRFRPLPREAVERILGSAGISDDRTRASAALAGGSAQRALALAEGDQLERRRERADRLVAAVRTPGLDAAFAAAAELAAEKDELAPTLELLALFYRDAAAVAAGVPPNDTDVLIHPDRADDLEAEAAAAGGPAALARGAALVLDTQAAIAGFASAQLALERMLLALREGTRCQTT